MDLRARKTLTALILFLSPLAIGVSNACAGETIRFEKVSILLGTKKIQVEVADTPSKHARGLMERDSLPADEGMLFVFDDETPRSFWMKNTRIPLSIAYFNSKKTLKEIIDMVPDPITALQPKTYPSRTSAQYALEMNIGWYERNKIRPGVSFRFADTSLEKVRKR